MKEIEVKLFGEREIIEAVLWSMTREQVGELAKQYNIPRSRNKVSTIMHLIIGVIKLS